MGPVVWHTTDPPILQNAPAFVHPFVAFELLRLALAQLKIWAELSPILKGLGNGAWGKLVLIVIPWLYPVPMWWINLTTFALIITFATFAALARAKVWRTRGRGRTTKRWGYLPMRIALCVDGLNDLPKSIRACTKLGDPDSPLCHITLLKPVKPGYLRQLPSHSTCPKVVSLEDIPRDEHKLSWVSPKSF